MRPPSPNKTPTTRNFARRWFRILSYIGFGVAVALIVSFAVIKLAHLPGLDESPTAATKSGPTTTIPASRLEQVPAPAMGPSQLSVTYLESQAASLQTLLAHSLQVSGDITIQGNVTGAQNGTFTGTLQAGALAGNGAGLTNVDASLLGGKPGSAYVLTSSIASLQNGAALLGARNTFTATNSFNGNLNVGGQTTLGGSVTISGPASLTGTTTISDLILSTPLPITQGGTGLTSVPNLGILYGQGGPSLGVATPGSAGLCLESAATDLQWGSCAGGAAVASVNSQTGAVTIANATGAGGTITIDSATTATPGLASFNAGNFSVVAGAVNTVQNIDVTASPTFAGLTLTAPLAVASGGTGATSLPANGVVVAEGTSPLSALVSGSAGDCLVSTAGAPIWAACPGTGGVATVDNLAGALTVADSTGTGTTITIQDASTAQKGIAQFNATNFSVAAGLVNTIQDIATTASPTFAGINTNSITPSAALTVGAIGQSLTLQGSNTTVTATNSGNTAQLTFVAPTANVTYRLQTAAAGTYDVCTTAGNCVGVGGSVSTSAAVAGDIPKYTSGSNLAPSLLTDNGTVVTDTGNLSVTGTVTFTSALAVNQGGTGATAAAGARTNLGAAASGPNSDITSLSGLTTALNVLQGGTGATTLTADGVLLGNGTSPISALAAASPNLCLESTAGAPTWAACTGGGVGGVTSLDNQSGVVTIADSTGSGSTVTIQNAAADGATKGVAAFNGTNFQAASGVINTVQDIDTGATPTFAGLDTNAITPSGAFTLGATAQTFTLQGNASSVFTATNTGKITTVGFDTPTASATLNFPALAAGSYDLCTTSGNCAGSGGGVTASGGANGSIAVFTGAQTLSSSVISQSGTTITVAGAGVIQGTGGLTLGTTSGNTGSITFDNSTNNNTFTLQAGVSGSNLTFTLPTADGSSGNCLTTDGHGNLNFNACLSGSSGGSGGVASLNGLSGALAVANATGSGSTVTIDDASTSQKGIAQFNAADFTASAGAIDTIQGIATTSTPTFAAATLAGANALTLGSSSSAGSLLFDDGTADGFTTTVTTATLGASQSITVPNASGTLAVSASGNIALSAAGNITFTGQLGILNGGTGANSAAGALANLGAAASGSNSDITSLSGLTTALSVAQGGTGATSLAADGVLIGGGTSALSSLVAGSPSLCLESTAGAPTWTSCPSGGGGGVTTLDSLPGALTIANSTGTGTTVTIQDASTSQLGLAQFNATDFTVSSGNVDTIQSIATSATPTFVGVDTNAITPSSGLTLGATGQAFTLQGTDSSVITATNSGKVTTIGFDTPTASAILNFPALAAGNYDLCTTSGNCAGVGGGVTTGGGTNNTIAKFTGTGSIGNSDLTDNGTTVAVGAGVGFSVPYNSTFGTTSGTTLTVGVNNVPNAKLNVNTSSVPAFRAYQAGTYDVGQFASTGTGVGTVTTNGTTTVTGTGTQFTQYFRVGDGILVNGQLRSVTAIASDTSLTVSTSISSGSSQTYYNGVVEPGTITTNGTAAIVGSGTTFTTTFQAGDTILINGESNPGIIAGITDDTHLTLYSAAATSASGLAYARSGYDRLNVKANGNVGVGTNSSNSALEVETDGVGQTGLTVQGANGQTANLLNVQANTGSGDVNVATITNTGATTLENTADSTAAFQVQDAGGDSLLNVDTADHCVVVGYAPSTCSAWLMANTGNDEVGYAQSDGTVTVGSALNDAEGGAYGTFSNNPLLFFTNNQTVGAETIGTNGSATFENYTNSTTAFQIQNASGEALLTADTTNTALVLGQDNTPTALTVRGGAAIGTDDNGANITFDASNGTGSGGSGSLIFRTAKPSGNAIALDNTGSMIGGFPANATLSFTTGTQSNRLLMVTDITCTTDSYTSVTYNGINLTQLSTVAGAAGPHVEMWYLLNPPSGTHNIVATLLNNACGRLIGASTFYNVDQTTPFGTVATASGTGTTDSSLNVATTSTAQVVVDGLGSDGGAPINYLGGQTQLWNQPPSGGDWPAAGALQPGTGGTVNMSWDVSGADWADIGVPLNPVANTTADSLTDTLDLAPSGDVGIDNENPTHTLDVSGNASFQNASDSTNAFQIQDAAGTSNLLVADTTDNRVGIGTATPSQLLEVSGGNAQVTNGNLNVNYGGVDVSGIAPPNTAVTANTTGSGVLNGTYYYYVSYLTQSGETTVGPNATSVTPASQQVALTNIPIGPAGVIGRRIYRSPGNPPWPYTGYLLTTINDNTTTTYTDNAPDSSLGAPQPEYNTTSFISNPQGEANGEAFGLDATLGPCSDETAIGYSAVAGWCDTTALGTGAVAANSGAVSVGTSSLSAWQGTAIGSYSTANQKSVALGANASAIDESIAIGEDSSATAYNQLVIGGSQSDGSFIQDAYIGSGITDIAPQSITIHATGGSGSNVAGANIAIAGGIGTGTGDGGNINFQVAQPSGSSSSTPNTLGTVASINGANGAATFENSANSSTAFQVQNAAGANLLGIDTSGDNVNVGSTGSTALASTINVGTSTGAAQTVNVGSNDGASATTIQGGTGNVNVLSTGNITIGQTPLSGSAFGYAGTGNNTGGCAGTCLSGSKFTTGAGGTIASMSVYFSSPSSGDQYAYAIYADSGGAPGSYIASSGVGTFGSGGGGWYTLPITATLAPSTTYWLVFNASGGTGVNFYTGAGASDANNTSYAFHSGPDNGFPATWPGGGAITGLNASIYATYTTGSVADVAIDPLGNLTATGATTFENANNSTTAFQVQDASSNDLLTVDTAGDNVNVGATGTTALASTINVGTSTGAAQTLNLGSTDDTSTTNIQGGTGGIAIQTGGNASGDSGSIILETGAASGTSGNILIDNGAGAFNSGSSALDDTFEDSPCSSVTTNFGPWGGGASSIVGSSAQAHGGSCSLAVTESATDGGYWGIQSTNFAITPGEQYNFTAWVRAGSLPQAIQGIVQWGGVVGSVTLSTVTDTTIGWTEMTGSGVAPSGGYNYAYFQFYNSGDGNGSSTTYLDDITATTNAGAPALDIGTSNAQTITVGNANQLGTTTLQGGGTSQAVDILASSGGTINVANSVAANTLNLGAVFNDEASTVNINSYSGGSAAKTTNLGSGDGASATTIEGGTGNVAINTGAATGNTGSIIIQTGNSASGTAGSISIDAGSGAISSGSNVENDTFESGTNNWGYYYNATVTQSTAQAHGGTHSLAMDHGAGSTWAATTDYPGNAVTAGQLYNFSAWVRGTSAELLTLGVTWVGGSGGFQTIGAVTDSTTGWTEITGSAVAPAGATGETLSIYGNDGGFVTTYLDDVVVSGGTSTPAVLLGSTNAAAVLIGNGNEAGTTTLQGGAGGIDIVTAAGSNLNVGTDTDSIVTVGDSAGTEPLTLRGDGISQTITGSSTAPSDIIKTTTDSTTAFQVQNTSGVAELTVDTTNAKVVIATASNTAPGLVVDNSDGTPAIEVRSGGSGGYNSFVGDGAGANNALNVGSTQGFQNSAFGNGSLADNTTGSYNTGLGMYTLHANHAGSYDTAVGNGSLQNLDNSTADFDTALGNNSANNSIDGISNTAIGSYSLYYSNSNDNTAVGAWALTPYDMTSGSEDDTALGYETAGIDSDGFDTPGSIQGSTAIGYEAQVQANNSLVLGGQGANAVNVGIGTTIPLNTFSVSPVYYSTGQAEVLSAGTTVTGLGTTWTSAMIGMQMIFGDGQSGIITAVGSGTSLTLNASQPITGNSNYRIQAIGFQVTNAGSAYVQNTSNTAFQVQNSAGVDELAVDTSGDVVKVKSAIDTTASTGLIIAGTNATGVTIGNAAANNLTTINGNALVKSSTAGNSTTAFQVQNTNGASVLNADTSNSIVGVGNSAAPSAVQEWDNQASSLTTLSVAPHTVGNLMALAIKDNVYVASVSGGGVSQWHVVTRHDGNLHEEIWEGTVTTTGASAITVTYRTTPGINCELAAQEFTSGLGANTNWFVAAQGSITNVASTTMTYPTLKAPETGGLYWGYGYTGGTGSAGSTSGFSYKVTSVGTNVIAYDPTMAAGTSYSPTATTTSAVSDAVAMIITASVSSLNINGSTQLNGDVTSPVVIQGTSNSTGAFQIQNASGSTLFNVDTANGVVSSQSELTVGSNIDGTTNPAYLYLNDVSSQSTGNALVVGQWDSSGTWGIGPNSNTTDSTLRIGVTVAGTSGWSTGQNVNLLVAGTEEVEPTSGNDSTTAFLVQNSGGANLLQVDTSGANVNVGATGTTALASTINVGTSTGAAQTVTAGSTDGASATAVQAGTGGVTIGTGAGSGTTGSVAITTGNSSTTASGNITIDNGTNVQSGTQIEDDDFETGTTATFTCWFSCSPLSLSTAEAHSPTHSLAVAETAGSWGIQEGYANISVTAGHDYAFTAWVRGTTAETVNGNITWDGPGVGGGNWDSVTDTTTGWTELTGNITAPPGSTNAYLNFTGSGGGTTDYIDDITVTDLGYVSAPYIHIGTTNAQDVTVGNENEGGYTTIYGGGDGISLQAVDSGIISLGTVNQNNVNIGAVGTDYNDDDVEIDSTSTSDQLVDIGGDATSGGSSAGTIVNLQGGQTGVTVANTGATVQTFSDSATALQVDDASSVTALAVSTNNVTAYAGGTTATLEVGEDSSSGYSITAYGTIAGGLGDYAEYFEQVTNGQLQPGEPVCLDSATGKVDPCGAGSAQMLVGVVSTSPGYVGNSRIYNAKDPGATALVSLVGQVPVSVSTANGPINVGDRLTYSTQSGVAELQTGPGMSIGTAMTSYSGTGVGSVDVYLNIGYYDPDGSSTTQPAEGSAVLDGDAAAFSSLNVSGMATLTDLTVTGTAEIANLTVTGTLTAANLTVNGHITTGGNAPSATSDASCATVTISGTDTAGLITVTSGAGCDITAKLASLAFAKPFTAAPHVTLTPADADAATLSTYVDSDTVSATGFDIDALTSSLPATKTYKWYYQVIQ